MVTRIYTGVSPRALKGMLRLLPNREIFAKPCNDGSFVVVTRDGWGGL